MVVCFVIFVLRILLSYCLGCADVFQGYGCQGQAATNNPLYQTTSSDYGWYTPSCHTVAPQYHPKASAFTDLLRRCGMYRNYSLNTAMDSPGCTCTAK